MAETDKKFLTVADVSVRWGIHKMTVYREVKRERLKPTRVAGTLRFSISEVERYERVS